MSGRGAKSSEAKAQSAEQSGAKTGRAAGKPSPLSGVSNQALQAALRGPGQGRAPRVRQGPEAERALSALGASGAAVGQNILLSRQLSGTARGAVLRHEGRHVAQVDGRDTDLNAPLYLGPHHDEWEQAASDSGSLPKRGADPQVVRRNGPETEELSSQPYGQCTPGSLSSEETDASTSNVSEQPLYSDPSTLQSVSPPMSSEPEPVSSEPESAVCEPPFSSASFNPEDINVTEMRNDELNSESLRVDSWILNHAFISPPDPDLGAYRRLQAKLKAERNTRVENGHLWMTTASEQKPEELFMLMVTRGVTAIVSVDLEVALGVPNKSFPGPVMSSDQLDAHLAARNIPVTDMDGYMEILRRQQAEENAESTDILPFGATGEEPTQSDVGQSEALPLRAAQSAIIPTAVGRLYRSPFSIRAAEPFAQPLSGSKGGEIMGWRGLIAETGYQSRAASGFGFMTDPLNERSWTNFLRTPNRTSRGNFPIFDFERSPGSMSAAVLGVQRVSVKTSLGTPTRRTGYYLRGLVDMLDARTTSSSLQHVIRNQPGQQGTAPGTAQYAQQRSAILENALIAVNADDVRPFRAQLSDATSHWNRAEYRRAYSGVMRENPVTIQTAAGPRTFDSPDALDVATNLSPEQIGEVKRQAGRLAADRVVSSGITTEQVSALRTSRQQVPANMSQADLGKWINGEFIESARFGGGARGEAIAAGRSGLRGGGASSVIAVITTAGVMLFDEQDHPNWEQELATSGGLAALGGTTESVIEQTVISRGTSYAISRGGVTWLTPRALRFGGGSIAAAATAPIMEGISMGLLEKREHSGEEIAVRSTRAAALGATSYAAGTAASAATTGLIAVMLSSGATGAAGGSVVPGWGTAIGFVVGLGVGAATYYFLDEAIPGSGEDYDRDAEMARRRAELERQRAERQAELERLMAIELARRRRLNTSLRSEAASVAGVEGMFGLQTTNPMFLASDPLVEPTVGELEAAYLISVLEGAEEEEEILQP